MDGLISLSLLASLYSLYSLSTLSLSRALFLSLSLSRSLSQMRKVLIIFIIISVLCLVPTGLARTLAGDGPGRWLYNAFAMPVPPHSHLYLDSMGASATTDHTRHA